MSGGGRGLWSLFFALVYYSQANLVSLRSTQTLEMGLHQSQMDTGSAADTITKEQQGTIIWFLAASSQESLSKQLTYIYVYFLTGTLKKDKHFEISLFFINTQHFYSKETEE